MSSLTDRKLTPKQKALVETIVSEGGSLTSAATKAGYAPGESGRATAYKTMKLPHVQEYMHQLVQQKIGLNAALALHRISALSDGAKSEYVQLQASQDILDRAGFKPIDRSQVMVAGDIKVSIDLGE